VLKHCYNLSWLFWNRSKITLKENFSLLLWHFAVLHSKLLLVVSVFHLQTWSNVLLHLQIFQRCMGWNLNWPRQHLRFSTELFKASYIHKHYNFLCTCGCTSQIRNRGKFSNQTCITCRPRELFWRPARAFLIAENVAKFRLWISIYHPRISSKLNRQKRLRPAANGRWSIWPFGFFALCRFCFEITTSYCFEVCNSCGSLNSPKHCHRIIVLLRTILHFIVCIAQWFSAQGGDPRFTPDGSWTILEVSRLDILCAQLHYICFIQVLDGVVGGLLQWVAVGKKLTTTRIASPAGIRCWRPPCVISIMSMSSCSEVCVQIDGVYWKPFTVGSGLW